MYAFLGKLSKQKIRLAALSYSLKMQNLLNSVKKMSILSGGGVLRNKKLSKGSTLSLFANVPLVNKELTDYSSVHIFSFYLESKKKGNPLLNYRSERDSPFIICK